MIRLNRRNEGRNKWTKERKNERWMKNERMRINEMNDWDEMTEGWLVGLVGQCQHERMPSKWTNEHTNERMNWKIDILRACQLQQCDNSMTFYDFDFFVCHEVIPGLINWSRKIANIYKQNCLRQPPCYNGLFKSDDPKLVYSFFLDLFQVVLTFESADEILWCNHSNKSYWTVLSFGTVHVYFAVQGGFNSWVFGRSLMVWPF